VLEWRIVPENVESYEAIFMENENRGIMGAAQLEFASSNTEKRLLHMPGGHWYAVVKETGYEEVARVGAYLAADFLTRRGTEIDTQGLDMSKDDRALLEDYSLMIQHTDAFFQKGGDDSCRCCGSHEAWFKVENHLLSKSPYFVNSHHKQVFKAVAGKLYDYLFMQNPLTSGASDFKKYSDGIVDKIFGSMPKDAYRQLMWIQAAAPKTWETLEDFAFFTQARALMARKRQQAFDKKYPKIEKSFAQYKQVA
jgi:hypothetical protein